MRQAVFRPDFQPGERSAEPSTWPSTAFFVTPSTAFFVTPSLSRGSHNLRR
jgi:hypothetical protein